MEERAFGEALAKQTVWGSRYTFSISEAGVRIQRCESEERRITVPNVLGGTPVVAIEPWAFAGLSRCEALVCPPQVTSVGTAAFAECRHLRQIVFPEDVRVFDGSWLASDSQIEDIVLPASAERIDLRTATSCLPMRFFVGAGTRELLIPAPWKGALRAIAIAADNPWLETDGTALYDRRNGKLIACALDRESYRVEAGCTRIADRAFEGCHHLAHVEVPASVRSIGAHTFDGTALVGADAWSGGLEINPENDALTCTDEGLLLERMQQGDGDGGACVNDGLDDAGDFAVATAGDGSEGAALAGQGDGRAPGEGRALAAAGDVPAQGASVNGWRAVACLDAAARSVHVPAGVRAIGPRAFDGCGELATVELPDGLLAIGEAAFAGCANLEQAEFPATLEAVGPAAFSNTALTSARIPKRMRTLGAGALPPQCTRITIDPGNPVFVREGSLLVRRDDGAAEVVRYLGPDADVVLPADTLVVAPQAFYGARGIDRLTFPARRIEVGQGSFDFRQPPIELVFELAAEDPLVLRLPRDAYGLAGVRRSLAEGMVDPAAAARACDEMVPYSDAVFERSRYAVERLADGRFLTDENRAQMRDSLSEGALKASDAFVERGFSSGLRALVDFGFLNKANITEAIDRAQRAGNVPMTALLLELKRERIGMDNDYAL